MIARYDWQIGIPPKQSTSLSRLSPRVAGGALGGVTAVFFFWLLLHYAIWSDWFAGWPAGLADTLRLLEAAGVITLTLLWLVWGWRLVGERPLPHPPANALALNELYALRPADFEAYVARLFRSKGYKVTLRGRSGDRGVDLELAKSGGKRAIVQCKRYQKTVGPDVVRELYGTLMHEKVAHAFLVTTADISDSAREWARGKPMTLIDGALLVEIATALAHNEP